MTRLRAIGALILLAALATIAYAQEQQRLENILILNRLALAGGVNLVMEGTTNDASETTLTAGEPTADRTITLPDMTGTVQVGVNAQKWEAKLITASGANPYSYTTGLATLTGCSVIPTKSTLANESTAFATAIFTASAGRLDIYRWRTTGTEATDAADLTYVCAGT